MAGNGCFIKNEHGTLLNFDCGLKYLFPAFYKPILNKFNFTKLKIIRKLQSPCQLFKNFKSINIPIFSCYLFQFI